MNEVDDEVPAAPDGLCERAVELWDGVVSENVLDAIELVLLETACRLVNQIDLMEAAVNEQGPVVKGSRGQPAASPLLREIRAHRLAVSRVLRQLSAAAPAEADDHRLTPSERGRRAAMLRHHGPRAAANARQGLATTTALDAWRNGSAS